MKQAILIAGLPASGKSHLMYAMAGEHRNSIIYDDPGNPEVLISEDREYLFASHPEFCIPKARKLAELTLIKSYPDIDIKWIFFENNPKQCLENSKLRENKEVRGYIARLTNFYIIPEDAYIVKVYMDDNIIKSQLKI